MAGVKSVNIDVDSKRVEVGFDKNATNPGTIRAELADAGWDNEDPA